MSTPKEKEPNSVVRQAKFNFKSKENKEYLITLFIIDNKITIKVNEIDIPLISYKISLSLEEFYYLSNFFQIFKSINEIYDNLNILIQSNIKSLTINYTSSSLELIIPIKKNKNEQLSFMLTQVENCKDEYNIELLQILKEIKEENRLLNLKLKEMNEKLNNNILLISDRQDSLLNNLLKISPFVNNITIIPPNDILNKMTFQHFNKFKIIIYDMKDYGYQTKENLSEIKQYLLNNGNIIVTHDQWTIVSYRGESYKLLGATLKNQDKTKVRKAKILKKDHPIFQSYFSFEQEIFDIAETHKSDTVYPNTNYLNDLLIELMDNIHGEYLMVKRFNKGKLIYWNAGHNQNLTDYEQKLFANIIAWIYKDN